MYTTRRFALLLLACPLTGAAPMAWAQQETPVDIVATQVRSQGYECQNPSSAQFLEGESKPDQAVYVLACDGVKYRVTLIPDEAARVEKLD